MVVVALHGFRPFADHAADVEIVVAVGIGALPGYQQAHLVGPVEEARIFHLLVLAHAIEAHLLGHADIVLDGVVVGRRERALRPIALVENHLQVDRTAVDGNPRLA